VPCAKRQQQRFIWQRSTVPLTAFVFKPSFNMDTSNKIRVVDQDPLSLKRTHSGGVRDPSDPKHYPTLDGTEGAVGTSTSQRTLSKFGSFKDALVARPDMAKVHIGREGSAGASPSSSPGDLLRTRRTGDLADALGIASPKVAARRPVQGDEPVLGGVGGAGEVGWSTLSQQVSWICDAPVLSSAELHALLHSKSMSLHLFAVLGI
jgi:hypothetical protein